MAAQFGLAKRSQCRHQEIAGSNPGLTTDHVGLCTPTMVRWGQLDGVPVKAGSTTDFGRKSWYSTCGPLCL